MIRYILPARMKKWQTAVLETVYQALFLYLILNEIGPLVVYIMGFYKRQAKRFLSAYHVLMVRSMMQSTASNWSWTLPALSRSHLASWRTL